MTPAREAVLTFKNRNGGAYRIDDPELDDLEAFVEEQRLEAKIEQVEAMERAKWEAFENGVRAGSNVIPKFKSNLDWVTELRAQRAGAKGEGKR